MMSEKPGFSRVGQGAVDDNSMTQIREILFGEQARQTATQFARLETRLAEQDDSLKRLLDQRVEQIDNAIERLREQMDAQDRSQQQALNDLHGSLSALLQRLDERLVLLDSDQQDARHAQRQAATDQAAALDSLANSSVDKTQLADLLEGLAGRLRDPSTPDSAEQ